MDIDADTWNLDPARMAEAVTPRTKAVLPVDVFGVPTDTDAIRETTNRHHLRVLEDSCEALGAEYRGRKAGRSVTPASSGSIQQAGDDR